MNKTFKWGIIGCGNIARKFSAAMSGVENSIVYAAASRNIEKAKAFAKENNISLPYGSYEEMLADEEIDAVYVATPHNVHFDCVRLALNSGKHVLCEKPLTTSYSYASEIAELAKSKNLFLAEAMWTKHLPIYKKVKEIVASGQIGDIKRIDADFCFLAKHDPANRFHNPDLAGGALFDLGIYVLSFADMFLGSNPTNIAASSILSDTRVDEQTSIVLTYGNGVIANLSCGINVFTPKFATIFGSKGRIQVSRFFEAKSVTVIIDDNETNYTIPHKVNGFEYEIDEAVNCIKNGKIQSDIVPINDTLNIMKIMDKVRNICNICYSFDR